MVLASVQTQIRDLAHRAVLLAVLLLPGACAQRYPLYAPLQTAGDHGYSDERLSSASYKVNYLAQATLSYAVTPARRSEEAKDRLDFAYDMALWRASELALANGYSAFTVADRTNDSHISVDYDRGVVPYSPTFYPYGMYDNYPTFPYPGEFARQTTINASVSLTIDFERDTSKPGAFDAKETIARLKAQYP